MRKKLQSQIDAIGELGTSSPASPGFIAWRKEAEALLVEIFGADSSEVQEFNAIYYTPVFLTCRMGDESFDEAFRDGLEEARGFLSALCSRPSSGKQK